MDIHELLKRPGVMWRVGMVSLILASGARWFLHPVAGLSQDMVDAIAGFLYGVAITSMLVGLWSRRPRHPRRPDAGGGAGA